MRDRLRQKVEISVVSYWVLLFSTTYWITTSVYDWIVWEIPMKRCAAEARIDGYQECEIHGKIVRVYAEVEEE